MKPKLFILSACLALTANPLFAQYISNPQMGMDSSTIGVLVQYYGNPYAQILPTQTTTISPAVTIGPFVQQLNAGTSLINAACYAGDPYQPSQYDYATWSNTCGSRFCRSRGFVSGFVSEYTGGNKNLPGTSNTGGAVVNCF